MTLTIVRNLLIALALAATATPFAAAGHSLCLYDYDNGTSSSTCVDAGSSTWGSCDGGNGSEATSVGIRQDSWGNGSYSYSQTSVGASCYAYTGERGNETYSGGGNSVSAQSYGYDSEGGYEQTSVQWFAYHETGPWGSYAGCDTVTSIDGQWTWYGCPAGNPPRVPALLP